jgi:hypothetical protein
MSVTGEPIEEDSAPLEPPCAARAPGYRLFQPDPDEARHWAWLTAELGAGAATRFLRPLEAVFDVAREGRCCCIVIEERYLDLDYRSEYSLFWSKRFEHSPPEAKRIHFFATAVSPEQLHEIPDNAEYLGYSVLRPATLGPVGRTVMRPPPRVAEHAVLCTVEDRPNLFGKELSVRGTPFCEQDGELLRCAHAATWLTHYVAQARGLIGRRTTAEIATLPALEVSRHRSLPSNGLTVEQMQSIFSAIGLPAVFYDAEDLPDPPAPLPKIEPERVGALAGRTKREQATEQAESEWKEEMRRERLLRVACKYINSGFPIVVLTKGEENHALTLIGWERREDGVRLYASDDMLGPYEPIDDVLEEQERSGDWVGIMLPLPEKVFLTGEAAEQAGWNMAEGASHVEEATTEQEADFQSLVGQFDHLRAGISVRTMLIEGRELKRELAARGRAAGPLALYRLAHLPHWVWLVEFQDVEARGRGEPCVLAEILFDSTSHDELPLTVLSSTLSQSLDHGAIRRGEDGTTDAAGPGVMWQSLILAKPDGGVARDTRAA